MSLMGLLAQKDSILTICFTALAICERNNQQRRVLNTQMIQETRLSRS